ncbi:MAG: transpeptidase family protein [Amoebophilaceae bacterium]|nr:transpeptidase family protein [Amoebophilaceae bacterium]
MAFKQTILLRTRIAFLAVLLFATAIVAKLVYIQSFQGTRWKNEAEVAGLAYRPIKATRGNIYADDGNLLATSLPFYRVALDPCIVDETTFQEQIVALSQLLANFYQDKSAEAYQHLVQSARQAKCRYLILNPRRIDHQAKKAMSQWPIFCKGRWCGGVLFEKVEKRFHPFKDLAARTIGFINANECGAGLEYSFNQDLKGLDGSALYQKITGGNWKKISDGASDRTVRGCDLETTIDINLQDVAHNSLLKALQASEAAYGCAVVMEVKTGEIKAIVNLSRTENAQYRECYNYAIGNQGATEPGSTFKLVSMLALLEETSVALTDTIDTGDGRFQFHDRIMKDVKRGGFGELTVQEVFEYSSNVGVARLIDEAFGKHPQKFVNYIHRLSLSKPLGLQMIGAGVPFIKDAKSPGWSSVTLPWMSIGYELKITPLHTLTLYNAVANHGKMLQPVIVKRVKRANKTVKEFQGTVLSKKICTDATLRKLQTMLEGVVERGTASKFRHGFYQIAGKSGTANKVVNGKYTNDTYASFVGYFPAKSPRYSCIVVIDSPQCYAWHFGTAVATVVKDIADKIAAKDLAARDFIPSKGSPDVFPLIRAGYREELLQLCDALGVAYHKQELDVAWVRGILDGDHIGWKANEIPKPGQVPHVLGMTLKDALFLLENCGLKVTVQGHKGGRVTAQSLLPNTRSVHGKTIALKMG